MYFLLIFLTLFALCCLSLAVLQMRNFAGTTKVIFPLKCSQYILSGPLLFAFQHCTLLTVLIKIVAIVKIPHHALTIY